jgi:hypothetical protein
MIWSPTLQPYHSTFFHIKNNEQLCQEDTCKPQIYSKNHPAFFMLKFRHFTVTSKFLQVNIFRVSYSPHFKHSWYIYTYRHLTADTIVLNVHMFVLLSSASILSSVTPASHLIHLTVWAPRLVVVWAYLDLYFKHKIKPHAEYCFWDYSMMVFQLQTLCSLQQQAAELVRMGKEVVMCQIRIQSWWGWIW